MTDKHKNNSGVRDVTPVNLRIPVWWEGFVESYIISLEWKSYGVMDDKSAWWE